MGVFVFNYSDRMRIRRALDKHLQRSVILAYNACPIKTEGELLEVVHDLTPHKLIQAVKFVDEMGYNDMLRTVGMTHMNIHAVPFMHSFNVSLPERLALPQRMDFELIMSREHRLYDDMAYWANNVYESLSVYQIADKTLHDALESCRTAGQVRLLMPDIIPFLSDTIQEALGDTIGKVMPKVDDSTRAALPIAMQAVAVGVVAPAARRDNVSMRFDHSHSKRV